MRRACGFRSWNLDVDRFLNPFIPAPPWPRLPYPVARWFGYRKTKPLETGNLMPIFWAFIGVFGSIATIEAVSRRVPSFAEHHAPIIVGSFGAAAVLEFYAIESPLAQPRCAIVGQTIAAIVGVAVAKLFLLNDDFEQIRWLGGALACAICTALMALTKTVHPPAGATALLAVVDLSLVRIGWFLIPVVLLGCALMLGVALLINNMQRQFPIYWWTPEEVGQSGSLFRRRSSQKITASIQGVQHGGEADQEEKDGAPDLEEANNNASESAADEEEDAIHAADIIIKPGHVVVPEHLFLTQEEQLFLETLSKRL